MSFSKNFSLMLICLAVGFVTCKCAPSLDPETLLAQVLNTDVSDLAKDSDQLRQVEVDGAGPDNQGEEEEVVAPTYEEIIEDEDEEDVESEELVEADDDLDDEDWEVILDPDWGDYEEEDFYDEDEEDDDDYWIGDDDWEDDFDYIDNKETGNPE